jgi:hypothetical protein
MKLDVQIDTDKVKGWAKAHAQMLGLIAIPAGIGLFARYLANCSIEAPHQSDAEFMYAMAAIFVFIGGLITAGIAITNIYKRLGIKL